MMADCNNYPIDCCQKYFVTKCYKPSRGEKGQKGEKGDLGPKGDPGDFINVPFTTVLIDTPVSVINAEYKPISWFAWLESEYGLLIGKIIFSTVIVDNVLDVSLEDETNNVVLGSYSNISFSGIYTFPFINPSSDAEIQLKIRKRILVNPSPRINSVTLNYRV